MNHIYIYLENAALSPASYYRLTQYFANSGATIHSALPDIIYTYWHRQRRVGRILLAPWLYLFYVLRKLTFLIFDSFRANAGDTIIISRVVVPHHTPLLHRIIIKRLSRRCHIIWDFDDNILESKTISLGDFKFLSMVCNNIVVTNYFLKSLVAEDYRQKVLLLPTTDGDLLGYDYNITMSQRKDKYDAEIRLVWVATASGLQYLQNIIPALDQAAALLNKELGKKLVLRVVCNHPLHTMTSCLDIVNIKWQRDTAKQEILNAHIGIMPLKDNEFTRGKGAFKLVQYMSAGLPVIASPVGFNNEVVNPQIGFLCASAEEWKHAILILSNSWENYEDFAKRARARYDEHYSYAANKAFWEKLTTARKNYTDNNNKE